MSVHSKKGPISALGKRVGSSTLSRKSSLSPKEQLGALRRFYVNQMEPKNVPPDLQFSPVLVDFANLIQGHYLDHFPWNVIPGTSQDRFIETLAHFRGRDAIMKFWCEAKKKALGVVFDCLAEEHFPLLSTRIGLNVANCLAILRREPEQILTNSYFQDTVVESFKRQPVEFSKLLHRFFYNESRRRDDVRIDMKRFVIANLWINNDLPLWLMRQQAILNVCQVQAKELSWSSAALKSCLRRVLLKPLDDAPISNAEFNSRKGVFDLVVDHELLEKMRRIQPLRIPFGVANTLSTAGKVRVKSAEKVTR